MGGEADPGPGGDPADQLVHRRVGHGPADLAAEQVHEHVVRVDAAVLDVHVLRVKAHQRCRDRHHRGRAHLRPRPVRVVRPGHDAHLAPAGDEVAVTQPERLARAHPGLGQQRQQEAVPQVLTRRQDRHDLPGLQGPRRPPRHTQLHRPHRDRPALGHVMQERLIRTAADPPPRDQPGGDPQAGPRMVVIKAENPRQVPVDRRRAPDPAPVRQHDHVGRRGTQPRHEPGHVLNARLIPARRGVLQELEPQLQANRVGAHRMGRALDRRQVGQVAPSRLHHLAVLPEQRPGLPAAGWHQHPLNKHARLPPGQPGRVRPLHAQRCDSNKACPQQQSTPNAASARSPRRSPGSAPASPEAWSNAPPAAALPGADATATPASSTAPTRPGSARSEPGPSPGRSAPRSSSGTVPCSTTPNAFAS